MATNNTDAAPRSRIGSLVRFLMIALILAGLGYGSFEGWRWWQVYQAQQGVAEFDDPPLPPGLSTPISAANGALTPPPPSPADWYAELQALRQRVDQLESQLSDLSAAAVARRLSDSPVTGGVPAELGGEEVATDARAAIAALDTQALDTRLQELQLQLQQQLAQQVRSEVATASESNVREVREALTGQGNPRAEATRLIGGAARRLQLEHDVNTTMGLLRAADQWLAEVSDPAWAPVREAIHQDIASLAVVAGIDVNGAYARLGALLSSVDAAPLRLPEFSREPSATAPLTTVDSTWSARAWRELSSLVRIRSDRQIDERPAISEQEGFLLREQLRLLLLQSQQALLRNQVELFPQSLNAAQALLNAQFDTSTPYIGRMLEELDALRGLALDVPFPVLTSPAALSAAP